LLNSIVEQTAAPALEVVVVDNDAAQSAKTVARDFQSRLPLNYLVEPKRGLARVRNRAVSAARGKFLAFIDDDEWASRAWLAELDHQADKASADVVIGPVTLVFEDGVPDYIRTCKLFQRANVSDGAPVPWYFTHTSNAYVRKAALPEGESPFATRYDLTGGEDTDLFVRMIAAGARIVGAERARVCEYRELGRANLRWVLRRSMRNGHNSFVREWSALSQGRRLALGVAAGWQGAKEGIVAANAWRRNRRRAMDHFVDMGERWGRLAGVLGIPIQEYRNHQ